MQQEPKKTKGSKGRNASLGALIAVVVIGAAFGAYRGLQQTQNSSGLKSSSESAAEGQPATQPSGQSSAQTAGQATDQSSGQTSGKTIAEENAKTEKPQEAQPAQADPNAKYAPGQEDFELYCISCHGDNGVGSTAPKVKGISWSVAQIEERIDKGTNKMPALGITLDSSQRKAIAEYVKTLK